MRIASGVVADRRRRYKELAAFGFGISAACKGALLAIGGTVGGLSAIILADRLGKGVRTAPRDALISLSSTREGLATSFGVHRAMDTAGAMLGPIVAFAILPAAPGAFDAVFAVSFASQSSASRCLCCSSETVRTGRRSRLPVGRPCGA